MENSLDFHISYALDRCFSMKTEYNRVHSIELVVGMGIYVMVNSLSYISELMWVMFRPASSLSFSIPEWGSKGTMMYQTSEVVFVELQVSLSR